RTDAVHHLDLAVHLLTELHRATLVVVAGPGHEDEGRATVTVHGALRQREDLRGAGLDGGAHEHLRAQAPAAVRDDRAHFQRARLLVDRVRDVRDAPFVPLPGAA